ncbi:hypothetical protein SAMN02799625_05391 [Methylobacterium sp. UNC300MFChir4.1]|jgi:hypothetical protein|uniref:hypothetical protein n=1 Tax=Methylobacterium sp. UNC300MFChir4.1 TaxID=1502747 RepID=UPI0008C948FE|nr:hypothetical protein [Methylobacterium sp. UNC300MFChir4.1]SEP30306.1 hypothetical protein SAMN02799625_05391 [Methylobacterium sp. UNC300MFChir4.1]
MSEPDFSRLLKPAESDQDRALRRMADAVHHLNLAVIRAVDAGLSVELVRASRHHDGSGNWGDQMVPLVRVREAQADVTDQAAA